MSYNSQDQATLLLKIVKKQGQIKAIPGSNDVSPKKTLFIKKINRKTL